MYITCEISRVIVREKIDLLLFGKSNIYNLVRDKKKKKNIFDKNESNNNDNGDG